MSADQAERPSGVILAARNMDWQQVVLNGGDPCFHLQSDGRFCGRHRFWAGHDPDEPCHKFVSLEKLLTEVSRKDTLSAQLKEAKREIEEARGLLRRTPLFLLLANAHSSYKENTEGAYNLEQEIQKFLSRKGSV